jgi:hypothetical protein
MSQGVFLDEAVKMFKLHLKWKYELLFSKKESGSINYDTICG